MKIDGIMEYLVYDNIRIIVDDINSDKYVNAKLKRDDVFNLVVIYNTMFQCDCYGWKWNWSASYYIRSICDKNANL